MRKKKRFQAKAEAVMALAEAGLPQRLIARKITGVVRDDLEAGGLYRQEWEIGSCKLHEKAYKNYARMIAKTDCWAALRHYIAVRGGEVEPKQPEIVIQQPPNIVIEHVKGKAKLIAPENDTTEQKADQ